MASFLYSFNFHFGYSKYVNLSYVNKLNLKTSLVFKYLLHVSFLAVSFRAFCPQHHENYFTKDQVGWTPVFSKVLQTPGHLLGNFKNQLLEFIRPSKKAHVLCSQRSSMEKVTTHKLSSKCTQDFWTHTNEVAKMLNEYYNWMLLF